MGATTKDVKQTNRSVLTCRLPHEAYDLKAKLEAGAAPLLFFGLLRAFRGSLERLRGGRESVAPARERPAEVGRVAIYKDDIPASGAPASPDYLARLLEAPAFSTAFLNSEQLADARSLSRERFDILVLPYGASFPVKAADNFRKFLRDGGKFFSTGGYAFDNLLERTAAGWQPPSPPPPPESEHVAWHCEIPAAQLRGKGRLTFSGFLKAANVAGPGSEIRSRPGSQRQPGPGFQPVARYRTWQRVKMVQGDRRRDERPGFAAMMRRQSPGAPMINLGAKL